MLRYLRCTPGRTRRRALFVDRDGVLNRQVPGGYVVSAEQLEFLDVAVPALRSAHAAGAAVVVVTNQGGLSRGLLTEAGVLEITSRLVEHLDELGVAVDGVYICPHHPLAPDPAQRSCCCRKPLPGLLLQAAADLQLDLPGSLMVGDQPSDLAAAAAAGIVDGRAMLVPDEADALAAGVAAHFGKHPIHL